MQVMILALALFACLSNAMVYQTGVSFQQGVNATAAQGDARFNYRQNTVLEFDGMFSDVSFSVTANGSVSGGTVSETFSANGIAAFAFATTSSVFPMGPPTVIVMFFNESGSGSLNSDATIASVNVKASAALVGKALLKVEELDTTGAVVNTIDLSTLTFTSSGLKIADNTTGLQYVSYTATSGGATYAFTLTVSAALGILNNGGAILTPTSVESFFEIDNYSYANANNNLRLTICVAHLSASISVAVDGTLTTSNTGSPDQIYVKLSDTVEVNGQTKTVKISGLASSGASSSNLPQIFKTMLTEQGTLTADVREITVDFPAGITSLTYDPTVGFGDPYTPTTGGNGGSTGTGTTTGGHSAGFTNSASAFLTLCLTFIAFLIAAF